MSDQPEAVYEMRVWQVADLPPMLDEDELKRELKSDEHDGGINWLTVAKLSVKAVREKQRWTFPEWDGYGIDHLAGASDRYGFGLLMCPPICIGSDGWIDGRHRSMWMILAGASGFAAEQI